MFIKIIRFLSKCYILLMLIYPIPAQSQWLRQTNGLPISWLSAWAINACDKNTVILSFTTTEIKIVHTQDAGQNWHELPIPEENIGNIIAISMVDSGHIWLCTACPAKIYFTNNLGANWTIQYFDTTKTDFFNYIEMFNLTDGVAMGDALDCRAGAALILTTSDGGNHWISVNDSAFGGCSGNIWRRIDFVNPKVGYFYASGKPPQKLFKTTDGGHTWKPTFFSDFAFDIKFFDENIGMVSSTKDSVIYRTLDGGLSWELLHPPISDLLGDIEFAPKDASNIWLMDYNHVFFSNDTGKTWTEQFFIPGFAGQDLIFIDSQNGWLLGNGGLYHTANAGMVVSVEASQQASETFRLEQNYPNPFNSETTMRFQLSHPAKVTLKIYNILGNEILILLNQRYYNPGEHSIRWDGTDKNGKPVQSGVYLYQIETDGYSQIRKLTLLR